MITYQYEEYKPVRQVWSWVAIILLAVITATWGMVTHMAVPEVVRHWDFDVLPDTPGSSVYATLPPPESSSPSDHHQWHGWLNGPRPRPPPQLRPAPPPPWVGRPA